jgi:hypothetical protein
MMLDNKKQYSGDQVAKAVCRLMREEPNIYECLSELVFVSQV